MEYGTRGIESLKLVLNIESREYVVGEAYGEVGGVGIVGSFALGCGDDIGISLLVVLSKTVGGGLCGSCLEVIEIALHFLIVGKSLEHMI